MCREGSAQFSMVNRKSKSCPAVIERKYESALGRLLETNRLDENSTIGIFRFDNFLSDDEMLMRVPRIKFSSFNSNDFFQHDLSFHIPPRVCTYVHT